MTHTAASVATFVPQPAKGLPLPVRAGELAVVVGAGASGEAAARLLYRIGARVRVLDRNSTAVSDTFRSFAEEKGIDVQCGAHSPEQFAGAAVVVSSPGVPLSALSPLLAQAGNPPLIAETELALRFVDEPVLAVTGTSGKTTTVTLAADMLKAAGKKVFLGGNIGTPLSAYVLSGEKADALVLELSSFQLQGSEHLKPKAAVLLNLTANHLDHHKDMAEYSEAKFRIFAHQTAEDLALLPEHLFDAYRAKGFAARVQSFGPSQRFSGSRLLGRHNTSNAEAAYLACREFGVTEEQAKAAVVAFAPLPHRLEDLGVVGGVRWVNDSKSTTVEAMRAALESFDEPVLLFAGGKFKGGDLESLRGMLREKARAVLLFGASREIFEAAWKDAAPLTWDATLDAAFARARALAQPGDVALLSPATSSFDLYANYKQRGDHLRSLVLNARKEAE